MPVRPRESFAVALPFSFLIGSVREMNELRCRENAPPAAAIAQ
jgi:hypothetical protein